MAERTYWLGRYMERIESTARLMTVNSQLLLDLPRQVRLGWDILLDITGIHEGFHQRFQNADERNIIRYLLSDEASGSSIAGALRMARENARTTRDIMPSESWEQINELYLFVQEYAAEAVPRGGRQSFLQGVIRRCQQISGLIDGSLAYNSTRDFIMLGRSLERADMTSRILDVGTFSFFAAHQQRRRGEELAAPEPYENILWMSVLRSLSAFQMYRQHVQERVNGEDVVKFLLQNALHPRSVVRCLAQLDAYLEDLPNHDRARAAARATQRHLWDADVGELLAGDLHAYIDELQLHLAAIHGAVAEAWFLHQ